MSDVQVSCATRSVFCTTFYRASALLAMQSAVLAVVNPAVCPSVCLCVRSSVRLARCLRGLCACISL